MTAVVEQRMDFRGRRAGRGRRRFANDGGAAGKGVRSWRGELEWPDSRAKRPWKYYDVSADSA